MKTDQVRFRKLLYPTVLDLLNSMIILHFPGTGPLMQQNKFN
jgi:hypothetical protein